MEEKIPWWVSLWAWPAAILFCFFFYLIRLGRRGLNGLSGLTNEQRMGYDEKLS